MIIDSQRLDDFIFTLLDDGTYEVGADSAKLRVATKIVIPSEYNGKSVTHIAEHGFCDMEELHKVGGFKGLMGKLKEVIIPDSITHIGKGAFEYCRALKSIKIPNSVETIEDFAFRGCLKLKKVILSDGVTSIGDMAFDCCQSLKNITLPSSITHIGDYAFGSNRQLTITVPKNFSLDSAIAETCKKVICK